MTQLTRRLAIKLVLWHVVGSVCFVIALCTTATLIGINSLEDTFIGTLTSSIREISPVMLVATPPMLLGLLVWSQIAIRFPSIEMRRSVRVLALAVFSMLWGILLAIAYVVWHDHGFRELGDPTFVSILLLLWAPVFGFVWAVLPRLIVPSLRGPLIAR